MSIATMYRRVWPIHMGPVLICIAAATTVTVLVLLAKSPGAGSSANTTMRRFVPASLSSSYGNAQNAITSSSRAAGVDAADGTGAGCDVEACLGQLIRADTFPSLQGMAKLRQQMFCQDTHPMVLSDRVTIVTVNNISMYVYNKLDIVSDSITSLHAWEAGEHEQIFWALQAPVPGGTHDPDPLMVDVGANVGWYTLNAASKGYRVVAIEGMRANQQLVRSSLCANPSLMARVTLHPFGLGAEPGQCYTFSLENNVGNGNTMCGVPDVSAAQARVPAGFKLQGTMQIKRLDTVVMEDVKVMKMDVEGYEPMVLQGAEMLFKNHKVWYLLVEFNYPTLIQNLAPIGKIPLDYIRKLQSLGYEISRSGFKGPWLNASQAEAAGREEALFNLYCVLPEAIAMQK